MSTETVKRNERPHFFSPGSYDGLSLANVVLHHDHDLVFELGYLCAIALNIPVLRRKYLSAE